MHGEKVVLMSRSIKILIDSGRAKIQPVFTGGKAVALFFLNMVTDWSRSLCHFHALIAQNLTVKFTRKMYLLSANFFSDS